MSEIAADVANRERVVGMHFFNPPALMKLVEVVAAEDSGERRRWQATAEVAERMGRTPIRAKDSPGFVANRLARPFSLESLRMLADGVADAPTIDRVCRLGGGFRMGPFELLDLIGLDVNLSVARSFYGQGGEPERWRPSPIQERMVAEGRLGRKSGARLLRLRRRPAPRARPRARRAGADPRPGELARIDPAGPEILPRLVAQIANEARLRAGRGGRRAGRHGHGDAARLQLAARPAGVRRADRGPARRRPARGAARAAGRRLPSRPAAAADGRGEERDARRAQARLPHTAARNREAAASLPAEDGATSNRRAAASSPASTRRGRGRADGRTAWDLGPYDFLEGDPPDTAHPSLWRLAG